MATGGIAMKMAPGTRACGRDGALHPAEQDSAGCKILEINLIDFLGKQYKHSGGRDGVSSETSQKCVNKRKEYPCQGDSAKRRRRC